MMTPSELAAAVSARGHATAVNNGVRDEYQDSFRVGWLQDELASALTVIAAADTPTARRYLERLQSRISAPLS